MFLPIRQRIYAQCAVEVAVIVEAAVDGDFGNRLAGIFQAVAGDEHAQAYEILRGVDTKSISEMPFKLSLGKTELAGDVRNVQALLVIGANMPTTPNSGFYE